MNSEDEMSGGESNHGEASNATRVDGGFGTFLYSPDPSSMMGDLSAAESQVFGKLDDIQRWQESTNVGNEPLEERKIQTIFQTSTGYCSLLLPTLVGSPGCSGEETNALRRNIKLLRQWGEAYSVADGTLDHLSAETSDISDTILMFLVEIACILCQRIPSLTRDGKAKEDGVLLRATEHMQSLIHHVRDKSSYDDFELEDDPMTEDETHDDTLQQCIADLHEYIQLLNELHPTIESLLPMTEDAPGPSLKEATDRGAYFYFSDIIRSKFKKAPDALADLLGRLNLERYNRMAAARDENLTRGYDTYEVPQTASVGPKATSFHDSGVGSSLPSVPPPPPPQSIAPTMFSTLAGQSRMKLPPFPGTARNSPFTCDFCGKLVWFATKREWNKHLIQDLQPYSCLELNCLHSGKAFKDRDDWIEHLKKDHHMGPEWNPVWCHLCQQWTQGRMVNVCSHFADHLEDIALAASPIAVTSDAGSDVDSTKSQGDVPEKTNVLQTIGEESMKDEEEGQEENLMDEDSTGNRQKVTTVQHPTNADMSFFRSASDGTPNCAICNGPANPECPCESERLQIAVKQAENRGLEERLAQIRDWAVSHARQHIINAFECLTSSRKAAHSADLSSLPNYAIYMQYSGHPPIHPQYIQQLQVQISEVHADLKRGIDADWRAAVLRYPEFLDYFYSLVELRIPRKVPAYPGWSGDLASAATGPPPPQSPFPAQVLGPPGRPLDGPGFHPGQTQLPFGKRSFEQPDASFKAWNKAREPSLEASSPPYSVTKGPGKEKGKRQDVHFQPEY